MCHPRSWIRQRIPYMPEGEHLLRLPERHANVGIHGRESPSYHDVVSPEMGDHILRRMRGIHHHKIRVGIDRLEHSRHRLIEEFLAKSATLAVSSKAAIAARTTTPFTLSAVTDEFIRFAVPGAAIPYPRRSPAKP